MIYKLQKNIFKLLFLSVLLAPVFAVCSPAEAAPELKLSGDQLRGPLTADPDGRYTFVNVPLKRNSVNKFKVTATDGDITQTREVEITQISLDQVVVSKIKAEPLSVEEIEQLVADGVIELDDPANFNVSKFEIVLTIAKEPFPISVPIVSPKGEETGFEIIRPQPGGSGGGRAPKIPDLEVIVFEVKPPVIQGFQPPPLPGVIVIEGRIKSLKEFYNVRLLLMNTSGIFTLSDVSAEIEFPDGGLSSILPMDGIVQYDDIFPGTGDLPGQKEREFIIRGDKIGKRRVKVNFGGVLTGPGIPEDAPVPFSGSAQTDVEVKGPPNFRVNVVHPPEVIKDVPYELVVDILNEGESPALYTSFELDVGGDSEIIECTSDGVNEPVCEPIEGSAIRNIGHLLPGERTKQTFTINPLSSGPISSCLGIADQNIALQVHVGNIGCLVGQRPPSLGVPDGIPTVSVLPTANTFGVGIDTAVTAFFSEFMNRDTISTGTGGTFNVYDDAGEIVPGEIRFIDLAGHTIAVWQVNDGITNRLAGNTTYQVILTDTIRDEQGNQLPGDWVSTFSTTDPFNDVTPPILALSVEPPVDPNFVLPGQIIRLNAYPSDQGSGVDRVELRLKNTSEAGSFFQIIDQKSVFSDSSEPCIFSIDSTNLVPGATYQLKATALDKAGNAQDATLAAIIAPNNAPPTIMLADDPVDPVLQGVSVTLTPKSLSAGVRSVKYFLDGAAEPFKTVTMSPFAATLSTTKLALGNHTIRAVAIDGLGQTGEDTFNFVLADNPSEPSVDFGGVVDGTRFIQGTVFTINGNATDPFGVSSVAFYLDDVNSAPIATSTAPFSVDTTTLAFGMHKIFFEVTNGLGKKNNLNDPASILEFQVIPVPVPGPPPAAPVVTDITFPVGGKVTVTGTTVPNASIEILNVNQGLPATVFADVGGDFSAVIDGESGELLNLTALDLNSSPDPSPVALAFIPTPPVLEGISVDPTVKTFTAVNQTQAVTVTGTFVGGATDDVTSQASFISSDPTVASVSTGGTIVAKKNGTAVITATVEGKTAQVNVTVNIVTLTSIKIIPDNFSIIGVGNTRQLVVEGTFSDSSKSNLNSSQVAFSTSSAVVAGVDGSGLVTSNAIGSTTITAAVTGLPPASSTVTVEPVVATGISSDPNAILFIEAGETKQLQITVNFNDGSTGVPAGPIFFQSNNEEIVTVDGNGLVTAKNKNGDTTLLIEHEGFQVNVVVIVDIPPLFPPPDIDGVDRPRAAEGDFFVIRGANFSAIPANNIVKVSGIQAQIQSARHDELVAIVPKGAVTGPVTVEVDGQESSGFNLTIYARMAESRQITPELNTPAGGGPLDLGGATIDFRAGDKVFLSGSPDVLTPISFEGTLSRRIDGGGFVPVPLLSSPVDLTALFSAGEHDIEFSLTSSGGFYKSGAIYIVSGPTGTGVFDKQRSVIATGLSQPIQVTFTNLTDLGGVPLPDGTKVVVTAGAHGFDYPNTNTNIPSHGGSVIDGTPSPSGLGLRIFEVQKGQVTVTYDPEAAPPLEARTTATARLQCMPATAAGVVVGSDALAVEAVLLTSIDTVATARAQTSMVADGRDKTIDIDFLSPRDMAGKPVPDGVAIVATAGFHGFDYPGTNTNVVSVGGVIESGTHSPSGLGLKKHIINGGTFTLQYNPGSVRLGQGTVSTANVQWLPSLPNGTYIGQNTFQVTPVTLSSVNTPEIVAPGSVFADSGDNRVIVVFKNFVDAIGNPVPDGTKVVVTAGSHGYDYPNTNTNVSSAGGVIISGTPSPSGNGLKSHVINGGQIEVTYSAQGVEVGSQGTATVNVQVLPAGPDNIVIGENTVAVAAFPAAGYKTASATANPPGVVADGLSKIVTITLTNIQDTAGKLVPDGAVVLFTAGSHGFDHPGTNTNVSSRGGVIVSGTPSPSGLGLRAHTVMGGSVTVQYDPQGVALTAGDVQTANVQAIPGRPGNNTYIGDDTFLVIPVTLTTVQQVVVQANPPSLLADGSDNQSTITFSEIKDAFGAPVIDGTKFVVTAGSFGFHYPGTNTDIFSEGGTIISGTPSPNGLGLKSHIITGGVASVIYSSSPAATGSRDAKTARVQAIPAQPNDTYIGSRAFSVVPITLSAYQTADIAGPGEIAAGEQAVYVVSNIVDTSGNPVPDGSIVLATMGSHGFDYPGTNANVPSAGGSVVNGTPSPSGLGLRAFVVTGGEVSITVQAPAGSGTSNLQLIPGRPNNTYIGSDTFAVKAISVTS